MENLSAIPAEGLKRGDVVFIKNTGSEIGKETHVVCGNHPAVIIQNHKGNVYSPNLIVAYLTSRIKRVEMLNKQLTTLQAQATELREYEEKIHHLADQMIAIDLDDGVKVNYAKFQDVLAKIK